MIQMKVTKICFLVVWSATLFYYCQSSQIGDDIAEEILKFANYRLGVQEFQDYLDTSINFKNVDLNAEQLSKEIAESMSAKLQVRIDALTGLRNDIESVYSSVTRTNQLQHCCTVPVYEKDPLLNTTVNYNEMCIAGKYLSSATEFLPGSFIENIKKHYKKALGIKYAYFGSVEGVVFNYPSSRMCDNEYDPRFRPWYVETSTPKPKDLVLVVDTSHSMKTESGAGDILMNIAKNAAITVMDTLNPNDRIGVVAFSTSAKVPSGTIYTSSCYRTELAKATPQNKGYLRSYINGLSPDGKTYYTNALTAAFEYFANTSGVDDTMNRDRAILFLTDGQPTEGLDVTTYTSLIASENAKLNNSVTILTFGLGSGVQSSILTAMAQQTLSDPQYGEIKQGVYTQVTDPTNLRKAMASYYEQFKNVGDSQVTFTAPYMDSFGSGLLISLCLPVNYQNTVKGITCMDLTIDDMLSDITYFREGESSYGFIVDKNSRVLTHPLLAFPSDITNDPYFIYLETLESVAGIDDISKSMASGKNGTKVTASRRVIPRGDAQLEGIYTTSTTSTYSWYPVMGTDFSICLVITDRDQKATIQMQPPFPKYVYHRLDLSSSSLKKCNQFNRLSVSDTSSLAFAARSFVDPFLYLNTEETKKTLDEYEVYLTGISNKNPGFRNGVRETVGATAKFEDIMQSRKDYVSYSVWRYVSTDNGIHRIFPAVETPKDYDATRTSWYIKAKANKGMKVLSTPYEDSFGAGTVVTLSQVLFDGNKQKRHTPTDKTIGVMGVDFTLLHFYYVTIGKIKSCEKYTCFIVDNAGYIVVHKDWIVSPKSKPSVKNVHIAKYEPSIATDLFETKAVSFTYDACVNLDKFRDQYFWKLTSTTDVITSNFELHRIQNTNVFLVIRKRYKSYQRSYACDRCNYSYYTICSSYFKTRSCFCPCYRRADIYRYCAGVFDFSGDTYQPCTPPLPKVDFSALNNKDKNITKSLENCYNYDCENKLKNSIKSCSSVISCSWCQFDEEGDKLDSPFCTSQLKCPNGQMSEEEFSKSGSSKWWISIIVLVLVGVVVSAIVYHRKPLGKQLREIWEGEQENQPASSAAYVVPPVTTRAEVPEAPPISHISTKIEKSQNEAPPSYGEIYPSEKFSSV